jgi:hypothetical protein
MTMNKKDNRFKKGKWYRYTGKSGFEYWSPDMKIVLDGKPHLCTKAKKDRFQIFYDSDNAFAAFDGGNVKDWYWDNFEEVQKPS